jgi:hypothetical protein
MRVHIKIIDVKLSLLLKSNQYYYSLIIMYNKVNIYIYINSVKEVLLEAYNFEATR